MVTSDVLLRAAWIPAGAFCSIVLGGRGKHLHLGSLGYGYGEAHRARPQGDIHDPRPDNTTWTRILT